jgi:hypothetical protein
VRQVEDLLDKRGIDFSYEAPAAFGAQLHKQLPASLCPAGSATQPIASTALMRNKTAGSNPNWRKAGARH